MKAIITANQARQEGLKRYFTGKPCLQGHFSDRLVSNGGCMECGAARYKRYYVENAAALIESWRDWKRKNPERQKRTKKLWVAANKDMKAASDRRSHQNHREQRLAKMAIYREANRDELNAKARKASLLNRPRIIADAKWREQQKRKATPPWASRRAIEAFYAEAMRMREETGVKHHVDHVVPLNGSNVCGLHVETNLQVITALANLLKGDAWEA